MKITVGVFVGGKGVRMGGVAKGLLPAPAGGETLLARALRLCSSVLPAAPRLLVGEAAAYAAFGLRALVDDPPGIGPLGGLRALLLEARRLECSHAIALSCDLPRFGPELLARLTAEAPDAAALAPLQDGRWQPFFARYACEPALGAVDQAIAAGDRALQRVLARLSPAELVLSAAEAVELGDWDHPEDLRS